MSAREEALALLRERFPEPWVCEVWGGKNACASCGQGATQWYAEAGRHNEDGFGFQLSFQDHDPRAAARACVAAWDEATKDERIKVRRAAGEAIAQASLPVIGDLREAFAAERALSDRLAEALNDCGEHQRGCPWARFEAGRPTEFGGYEMMYAGKWYEVKPNDLRPKCTCGLNEALAALAERRKG